MSIYISFVDVEQSYNDYARIGYSSIITAANISGTAGTTGFALASVVNPATYERYTPVSMPATIQADAGAAVACDYVGIAAHNLGSKACTVYVESSADNLTWTTRLTLVPADDTTIMGLFDSVSARYWRVRITGTTAPTIGVVYLGAMLTMQRTLYSGHTPLTLARVTAVRPSVSATGQFLGATQERKGFATDFAWRHLTADWYRANFDPFVATNPRCKPFFIAWRPYSYPTEVGYCWATGDIKPSNSGPRDFMEVSLSVEGFSDRA
jgi:hypothetical protein